MSKINAQDSLQLLIDGNRRFSAGVRSVETAVTMTRMRELAENGQRPFAIILTCSDSRVPTEIVFDRGAGDLFVIRVAGNVVSPTVIASIEYGAAVLGSELCVVMGHSQCGAVSTALQAETEKIELTPNLATLMTEIRPSVREVSRFIGNGHEDHLHLATTRNAQRSVTLLSERSKLLRDLEGDGKLKMMSAMYDLHTGIVTFHPESAHHAVKTPVTA